MAKNELPTEFSAHRILSTEQSATLLGQSIPSFRRSYRQGLIPPPIRIGARKYGWRASDLLAFLEKKASEAGVDRAA